jgi:hypothetical protein
MRSGLEAGRRADEYDLDEEEEDEDEEPFSYPGEGRGAGRTGGVGAPQIPPFRGNSGGAMGVGESPFSDEYRTSGGGGGGPAMPAPASTAPAPGVSRTMQYADPYAAIKANLAGASGPTHAGGNDYPYTGYR